jgi:hypothetical protein
LPEGGVVAREFNCLRFVRTRATEKSFEPVELKENEPRNFAGFTFMLKRGMARASLKLDNHADRERFAAALR